MFLGQISEDRFHVNIFFRHPVADANISIIVSFLCKRQVKVTSFLFFSISV